MKNPEPPIPMSEDDYLKVIDAVNRIYRCETRDQLAAVVRQIIFPLLKIDSFGSSWIDFDLSQKAAENAEVLFQVGFSNEDAEIWQKVFPYQKDFTRIFATSLRPALAFDVDVPRANLQNLLREFLDDHPQYDKPDFKSLHTVTSMMALTDPPDFNFGVGMMRFKPNEDPFTPREVRMAELIRPSLIRALKFIAINEELQTVRSLVDHLTTVSVPLCLVNFQGLIAFSNEAFQSLTKWKQGEFLPKDLTALLKQKEEPFADSQNTEPPTDSMTFYTLPSGSVRCSWTRLKQPGSTEDGLWLLKLKPVTDPYSKTLLLMEQAGLTPREIEVAARMHDGLDDADIAQRLFISPHTLKNHFKRIYQKLDVHSRTQLVARLRPSAGEQEL